MEEEFQGNTNELYIANDGTKWRMLPQVNLLVRRRQCDLFRHLLGVRGQARNAESPIEALKLFFTDEMLEEYVAYTNNYIASIRNKFSRPRGAADTNLIELMACLCLLFLGGVLKVSHTRLKELWNTDCTGVKYFRLTMSLNRFKFILKCLRFDDIRTKAQIKVSDN